MREVIHVLCIYNDHEQYLHYIISKMTLVSRTKIIGGGS